MNWKNTDFLNPVIGPYDVKIYETNILKCTQFNSFYCIDTVIEYAEDEFGDF